MTLPSVLRDIIVRRAAVYSTCVLTAYSVFDTRNVEKLITMYKNRECASRMIGSAAIGVAVGMLVQKILSPRTPETSAKLAGTPSTIRFEYVQQPPEANNLQVPSYYRKNRRHHQFRSKSDSGPEDRRQECNCLSVQPHLLQTSKQSVSESDLRSNSGANNDTSKSSNYEKCEVVKNLAKVNSGSNNDLQDCDDVFLNTLTEYLPLKLKHSRKSSNAIPSDFNLKSIRGSFTNKSTECLSHKLKDAKNLHDAAEDCGLNFHRESSVTELTENSPFKSKKHENFFDTTKDHNLNSCCETFTSKSMEYIPLKLKDGKYQCDTARNCNVKSNYETFTSTSTEYLSFKLKDGKNFCDTANICNLKSYRKNSTGNSTEFLYKKPNNESKASVPLLLLDISSRKSKTKSRLLASSVDNHTGDEISNCSAIATCDTVEKDYNFNSYSKDHSEITIEKENISTTDFGTLPTFYGSKVLASIVGNESLQ